MFYIFSSRYFEKRSSLLQRWLSSLKSEVVGLSLEMQSKLKLSRYVPTNVMYVTHMIEELQKESMYVIQYLPARG
jgi:hypothetical protein